MPRTDAQALRELKTELLDVCQQMRTLAERARGGRRESLGARDGRRRSLTSLDTDSSDETPLHKVKVS